ncbi:hypothetical protein E1B28_013577 [Marasmius oreades]|uniref:Uncharacterized protein n=1 Tax=Marasmius oreades TaxID=181124 RepID=A0A9P7RPT7_9AGAR|nr:uncharacterized protein E1B28_013577 [Marasmius oreades]KAG7087629.1 hypothetical protein E1B28_013577 [Marasmius oreades]
MNRKAQTLRHAMRPSLALGTDDLGVLREGDESNEDVLRRQLLEKDRECDRLQTQVQLLQDQLSQRPPLEAVQELEKEYKNLDLLLQGTQRENERCMAEIERGKTREKMLERELTRLAGENWQSSLDIAPTPSAMSRTGILHQRSNTLASPISTSSRPSSSSSRLMSSPASDSQNQSNNNPNSNDEKDRQALAAHIEQVRMLVLGVEQRVQAREEKLRSRMERAEEESKRFDTLRKEIVADS